MINNFFFYNLKRFFNDDLLGNFNYNFLLDTYFHWNFNYNGFGIYFFFHYYYLLNYLLNLSHLNLIRLIFCFYICRSIDEDLDRNFNWDDLYGLNFFFNFKFNFKLSQICIWRNIYGLLWKFDLFLLLVCFLHWRQLNYFLDFDHVVRGYWYLNNLCHFLYLNYLFHYFLNYFLDLHLFLNNFVGKLFNKDGLLYFNCLLNYLLNWFFDEYLDWDFNCSDLILYLLFERCLVWLRINLWVGNVGTSLIVSDILGRVLLGSSVFNRIVDFININFNRFRRNIVRFNFNFDFNHILRWFRCLSTCYLYFCWLVYWRDGLLRFLFFWSLYLGFNILSWILLRKRFFFSLFLIYFFLRQMSLLLFLGLQVLLLPVS